MLNKKILTLLTPFGLLLVVISIFGVVSLLKYLSNSSIFYSPIMSSSSILSCISVSSGTLMLSIVAFFPLGTAISPNSSLSFFVYNDCSFFEVLDSILLLRTTS